MSLTRKARWSVPTEPALGEAASILKLEPGGNWVAEQYKVGDGASWCTLPVPPHPTPPL